MTIVTPSMPASAFQTSATVSAAALAAAGSAATDGFKAWNTSHVAALAIIAATCIAAWAVWRGPRRAWPGRREVSFGMAVAALLLEFSGLTLKAMEPTRQPAEIAPLHLCDLSLILTATCLLWPAAATRWPFEFLYGFGLMGALQALLTPDLPLGFPSARFLVFFAAHGLIAVGVFFMIGAEGRRPHPGFVWRTFLLGNVYMALAGAYNAATGANFGYLCRKPDKATLLDSLGPWPWYLLAIEALGLVSLLLAAAPFAGKRDGSQRLDAPL